MRLEIRAALYLGVLLLTAGIGLFVKENHERIGPATIGVAIGILAAACLVWAARRSAPFAWGEATSAHAGFDYVLLLGALLVATDLGYLETQFALLGRNWPWHLLVVALLYGLLAYRFDSKMLLSLALASFAAWRGIAVSIAKDLPWLGRPRAPPGRGAHLGRAFRRPGPRVGAGGEEGALRGRVRQRGASSSRSAASCPESSAGEKAAGEVASRAPPRLSRRRIRRVSRQAHAAVRARGRGGVAGPSEADFRRRFGRRRPEPFCVSAMTAAAALILIVAAHRKMRVR